MVQRGFCSFSVRTQSNSAIYKGIPLEDALAVLFGAWPLVPDAAR